MWGGGGNEVLGGEGSDPHHPHQLGACGSAVSSPNGVRGPAKNDFDTFSTLSKPSPESSYQKRHWTVWNIYWCLSNFCLKFLVCSNTQNTSYLRPWWRGSFRSVFDHRTETCSRQPVGTTVNITCQRNIHEQAHFYWAALCRSTNCTREKATERFARVRKGTGSEQIARTAAIEF